VVEERLHVVGIGVGARPLDPADAVLLGDVVGVGDERAVGRVGDHQLDGMADRVLEQQAVGLGRIQADPFGEDLLVGHAIPPPLQRLAAGDAQDDALDRPATGAAALELLPLHAR
jgi:hypothetical protein